LSDLPSSLLTGVPSLLIKPRWSHIPMREVACHQPRGDSVPGLSVEHHGGADDIAGSAIRLARRQDTRQ